jgi:hypothetical protein
MDHKNIVWSVISAIYSTLWVCRLQGSKRFCLCHVFLNICSDYLK